MTSALNLSCPPPKTADFSEIWPYLEAGVHELMDSPENISASQYLNVSVSASSLAEGSKSRALDVQKKLENIFVDRVQAITKEAVNKGDADFLQYYVMEFLRYKTSVERVDRVFALYNRRWSKVQEENGKVVLPILSLALARWKEKCAMVLQKDRGRITSAILNLIAKERSGESVDETLVKNAIDSLITLDIDRHIPHRLYQEDFEAPFLKAATEFYKKEFGQVLQSKGFVQLYLNTLEERFLDEEHRAERYLPQNTHDKAISTVFIPGHCEDLAESLLESAKYDSLGRMYTLLSRIKPDGLVPLKTSFEEYVKHTDSKARDTEDLSDIHQIHMEIVNQCFNGDTQFAAVLRKVEVKKSMRSRKKRKT